MVRFQKIMIAHIKDLRKKIFTAKILQGKCSEPCQLFEYFWPLRFIIGNLWRAAVYVSCFDSIYFTKSVAFSQL